MWLLSLLAAFSLPSPPAASRRQLLSRAAASLPAPAALAFAAEAPSSVRVKGAAEMDLEFYARGLLLGSGGAPRAAPPPPPLPSKIRPYTRLAGAVLLQNPLGSVRFLFFLQDPARSGGDPVLLPPSLGVSVLFIQTLRKTYGGSRCSHSENTVNRATPLHTSLFTPDVELHSRSSAQALQRSSARSASLQLYSALGTLYSLSPSLSWRTLHLPANISRAAKAAAARAAAASEERGSTT